MSSDDDTPTLEDLKATVREVVRDEVELIREGVTDDHLVGIADTTVPTGTVEVYRVAASDPHLVDGHARERAGHIGARDLEGPTELLQYGIFQVLYTEARRAWEQLEESDHPRP